ncbi:MAG: sigma-54-dependent Fis family transcriptional regulator [Nitrospirae bacterium]|nr:MAG: sigma-54-dependent Fis family transcriptional regulator [Nitrospirota bacterium]
MDKKSVLVIEDEKIMRITIEDALKAKGYSVKSFEKGLEGVQAYSEEPFDIVLTDVRLPDINGMEVLKKIKEIDNSCMVILMTAFGTIKDAVEAMKLGAFDYITKPFSLDELALIINRAAEVKDLQDENLRLKKAVSRCYCYPNIIGESDAMKDVFRMIDRLAQSDSTVLILGESGTGKELVASTIHYQGKRKDGPFVVVNCGALPENLIESELFGYEKGAFTGATRRKPGRFELANGGTLFLDEVGELPPAVQVKLLRVLQDGTFERLGGTESIKVDVRVIAATNRDLETEVKEGNFREDLYYRLAVIPLTLPPLRERREDIPLLIEHFLQRYNSRLGKQVSFSKDAVSALMEYHFPGNVRELENIVERMVTLCEGDRVTREDLPSHLFKKGAHEELELQPLTKVAQEAEKQYIVRVLRQTGGNRSRAASVLGISRKTLWEKMRQYGIGG